MKIGFPGGSRPEPWDRNPSNQSQFYRATGLAVGGPTQRWAYTVPTGRKALVASICIRSRRRTVSSGPATIFDYAEINGAITVATDIVSNVVEAADERNQSGPLYLTAGTVIKGFTGDTSVDGTHDAYIGAIITEFDA